MPLSRDGNWGSRPSKGRFILVTGLRYRPFEQGLGEENLSVVAPSKGIFVFIQLYSKKDPIPTQSKINATQQKPTTLRNTRSRFVRCELQEANLAPSIYLTL